MDSTKHLVSLDPSKRPEDWVVEFQADDGTTEYLEGEKHADFEGLYFRYPPGNLYAWLPPRGSGTIHVTVPDGTTTEVRWHG